VYEVGIVTEFEAQPRAQNNTVPTTHPHDHGYRVEICVRGDGLRQDCTLPDLSRLQSATTQVIESLQHQDLDALETFQGLNSSGEMVARHIHCCLSRRFRGQGLTTLTVRVWESASAYALYEAALAS